jgi:hypothetical protein
MSEVVNGMKRTTIYFWIVISYTILLSALKLSGNLVADSALESAVYIITPALGILLGIDAIAFFGLKTSQAKGILLILLGLMLWYFADLAAAFEWLPRSWRDPIYFIGYIGLIGGEIFGILTIKENFFQEKKYYLGFFAAFVACFLLYWLFPLGWDSSATFMENVFVGGYLVLDLWVFVPIAYIISFAFTGAFSKPWIIVSAGLLTTGIADFLFTLPEETQALWYIGNPMDLGWLITYPIVGIGFLLMKQKAEEILAA